MHGVVFGQLFEQARIPFLAGQEEQGEEVEEREGGKDADGGFGGVDGLGEELGVCGCEARGEELEGRRCRAEVAEDEVGEDGAGGVRCGQVGGVGCVPCVV